MKRVACIALLYGKPYLAWAMRSVNPVVDAFLVLYTGRPSFGHGTAIPCPETEEELRREAHRFITKPLTWISRPDGFPHEGAHRDAMCRAAAEIGATQILVLDSDELWDPATAKASMDAVAGRPEGAFRAKFVHFWRSIKWLCRDGAMPTRVLNVGKSGDGYVPDECQAKPVFHFGYALPSHLVEYKWLIHGHLNELRNNWFQEKFMGWRPGMKDTHPTCEREFWNPEPTDAETLATLKPLLHDHPYWKMDVIP